MKKRILLTMVAVCLFGSAANAMVDEIHGTIDATYVSRYIWRGYDAYPSDDGAIQPSIDLDLFGTGFGFTVWMSRPNQSGHENSEWLTYTLYYKNMVWAEENYAMAYKVGYTYFSSPDGPKQGTAGEGGADVIHREPAAPHRGAEHRLHPAQPWHAWADDGALPPRVHLPGGDGRDLPAPKDCRCHGQPGISLDTIEK